LWDDLATDENGETWRLRAMPPQVKLESLVKRLFNNMQVSGPPWTMKSSCNPIKLAQIERVFAASLPLDCHSIKMGALRAVVAGLQHL
jgi:hypothetical protein